ncbi:hypothetical protein SHKM778_93230 [Streptomyces sp. KM77-8]|uniref:Uncharacterized protein n=1 Tax=Streptomyces haneummycinicus TaxID=3074435 RepID=A0AAT9HZY9_9ACTN
MAQPISTMKSGMSGRVPTMIAAETHLGDDPRQHRHRDDHRKAQLGKVAEK